MSKKTSTQPPKTDEKGKTRRINSNRYNSFKLQKRIKPQTPKLPSVWRLFKTSIATLTNNWKLFTGISLIYGALSIILVHGFIVGQGITETKLALDEIFTGAFDSFATGASLFLELFNVSSTGENQAAAGAYQLILFFVVSLALIWALRQVYAKNKVRIRDSFYRGMYPLATFVLVMAVIALQLLPALVGAYLYGQVSSAGIAATTAEMVLWGGIFVILSIVSLYLVTSSIFALYVVCLPDMTPMRALGSARSLVRYRRWTVMRKVIALPVILFLIAAVIIIPLLIYATPIAPWVFLLLSVFALALAHSYMYELYRSLL